MQFEWIEVSLAKLRASGRSNGRSRAPGAFVNRARVKNFGELLGRYLTARSALPPFSSVIPRFFNVKLALNAWNAFSRSTVMRYSLFLILGGPLVGPQREKSALNGCSRIAAWMKSECCTRGKTRVSVLSSTYREIDGITYARVHSIVRFLFYSALSFDIRFCLLPFNSRVNVNLSAEKSGGKMNPHAGSDSRNTFRSVCFLAKRIGILDEF